MLDEKALAKEIAERLSIVLNAFLFALLANIVAWWKGFFQKPLFSSSLIKGENVLSGFAAFLLAQVIIMPILIIISFAFIYGQDFNMTTLNEVAKGWLNLLTLLGGFLGVSIVFWNLRLDQRREIWGDYSKWYYHLFMGILTWFISFPVVVMINQLISISILFIFRQLPTDQVVARNLKAIVFDPPLFWATIFVISCLVPLVEECLFRGFLQSWLKSKIKRVGWAIVGTSLIFALFHYSVLQGISNIELLCSLFVLSCFLGFLYERQRSLWAPIGLHGFFNAMGVMMIINA